MICRADPRTDDLMAGSGNAWSEKLGSAIAIFVFSGAVIVVTNRYR
jgi:hypothetical protein